jgi:group I intron endonuclease
MGYIYEIKNKITFKRYIGQTIQEPKVRWSAHKRIDSNCIYLKRAFEKYGIENFEFKVLIICFDEDVYKYEIEYIKKFNTVVPNGYNLSEGGTSGFSGCKHSEETKLILSEKSQKYFDNEENLKKNSDLVLEGLKNIDISDKMEKSEKWQNVLINHKFGYNQAVPVIQLDNDNNEIAKFYSIAEASQKTNTNSKSLLRVLNGLQIKAGGFKWIKDISNNEIIVSNSQSIAIIQYSLDNIKLKEYISIAQAAKVNNFSKSAISANLKGESKTSNGFIWKYKNQEQNKTIKNNKPCRISQYDLLNNKIKSYDSISKASKESGYTKSGLIANLQGKSKTYKGFIWKKEVI